MSWFETTVTAAARGDKQAKSVLRKAAAAGNRAAREVMASLDAGLEARIAKLEADATRTVSRAASTSDSAGWFTSLVTAAEEGDRQALRVLRQRANDGDRTAASALHAMKEPTSDFIAGSPQMRAKMGFRPISERKSSTTAHAIPLMTPSEARARLAARGEPR